MDASKTNVIYVSHPFRPFYLTSTVNYVVRGHRIKAPWQMPIESTYIINNINGYWIRLEKTDKRLVMTSFSQINKFHPFWIWNDVKSLYVESNSSISTQLPIQWAQKLMVRKVGSHERLGPIFLQKTLTIWIHRSKKV